MAGQASTLRGARDFLSSLFYDPVMSRRQMSLPEFGAVYLAHEQWIKEGKADDSDIFPWLRGVQKMGFELTIIGSTIDACNVCIEAWNAGFKPVLIIMEDQVAMQPDGGEEVYTRLNCILTANGGTGVFRHGPVVIFSDSSKCLVHLDSQGRVMDTLVRTNIAGINSHSESWQLFKGPAIVVDLFPIPGVDEARAKEVLEEMMKCPSQGPAGNRPKKKVQICEEEEELDESSFFELDEPVEIMATSLGDFKRHEVRTVPQDKMTVTRGHLLQRNASVPTADQPQQPSTHEAMPTGNGGLREVSVISEEFVTLKESAVDKSLSELCRENGNDDGESEDLQVRGEQFLSRVALERAAVVEASYWEKRYDPDAIPMSTVTIDSLAPLFLWSATFGLIVVLAFKFIHKDFFGWWRMVAKLLPAFATFMSLATMYYNSLGLAQSIHRPNGTVLITGILLFAAQSVAGFFKVWGYYMSDFTTDTLAFNFAILFMPLITYWRARRMSLSQLLWYNAVVSGTFGYWVMLCVIILVYLILMTVNVNVASLFLTIALGCSELMTVELNLYNYNMYVYKKRKGDGPNVVCGDQKATLGMSIVGTHMVTESARLVALICGAVRADSVNHLQSVALSAASALVLNSLSRTMWTSVIMARVVGQKRASWVCPTFITAYHMECKFASGWPRFFTVFGIMLGRGFMHGNWNTEWIQTEPDMWCWNGIVLITVLISFLAEILEDWIVFTINGKYPAPLWKYFADPMMEQFNQPGHSDVFHSSHYLVPMECLPDPECNHGQALDKMIKARERLRTRRFSSRAATTIGISAGMNDVAPRLVSSPNFRCARRFTFQQMLGVMGACTSLIATAFNVGLGSGSFQGYCWPLKLEGIGVIVRTMFLISTECECEVGNRSAC